MTDMTKNQGRPDNGQAPNGEQLLDASGAPLVVINREYTIVGINQSYCEHYGVNRADVIGRRCHEVSHGSAVPCSQHGEHCPLEAALASGRATQVIHTHRREDGSEERVQLEANPIRGTDGSVQWVIESVRVVTEISDADTALVGHSAPLLRLVDLLQRVAPADTTVLLLGESGTGKERAAQYVHAHSQRAAGPFVVFDCGSVSGTLIESELFGYEKGAFTGAAARKLGLFEAAAGGTLFIDEIGDLPVPLQGRLLRVLETSAIRPVGSIKYVPVDVRIVVATNRDLAAMVKQGRFREDLLFRLSAFPIRVPTLRERLVDVPELASQFLTRMRGGRRHVPLSADVVARLIGHTYPGNVRELRNTIERAIILAERGALQPEHIIFGTVVRAPDHGHPAAGEGSIGRRRRPADEEILEALARASGHRARAAELLGVNERTLYRHLTRLRSRPARA